MIKLIRTDSNNPDFIELVRFLDADLTERDGEEHSFYDQFNKITHIKHVVVAYTEGVAVGCGAIKLFDNNTMEVKRMYTAPQHRGKGMATIVLTELENWAKEMSYTRCVLETGKKQPEAVELYKKNGYNIIPNYGQYIGIENSVCFEKQLAMTEEADATDLL